MTSRFNADALRRLAGDAVYARGQTYHRQGLVEILDHTQARVLARVAGNEDYRTVLTGKGADIDGSCSCPAFDQYGFCKHMVAVALTTNAAGPPEEDGTMERIRRHLLSQDVASLTARLLDLAERDEALFRRLDMESATASGDDKTVQARLRKAITTATRTRGFIDYHAVPAWADGVEQALESVATLVSAGRAALARPLAEYAMDRISTAITEIDDSDGYGIDLMEHARDVHLAACRTASPEPQALARTLFAWETGDDWGAFTGTAEVYADALGPEGLAEYRRLAAAAWDKLPPVANNSRRIIDEHAAERRRLMTILDGFAARDGDIDTRISLRAMDLSSPGRHLDLARFCLDHGRKDEALRHAEDGLWLFEDAPPHEPLISFTVDLYVAEGRNDAAVTLLRRAFERRPSLSLFFRLRDLGGEAARNEAIACLTAQLATAPAKSPWSFTADLLLQILMSEKLHTAAWHLVHSHGVRSQALQSLAEASEATHPEEAVATYTARIDELVATGGNGNYQEAFRLLARLAHLRDATIHAAHVADLKVRFKAKRNFMKLLAG